MAFSDDFLYRLTSVNPISDVMRDYVSLIQKGNKYVCSCPFHSEKTPSCTVYPDTQSFYCFGCGAGGDVITFIKKIENVEYPDAVELLAKRAGLSLPDNGGNESARLKTRIYEINRESARFFHKMLAADSSKAGLKYLMKRGLTPNIVKKYGLGYAPDSWDKLKLHLHSLGFKDAELLSAGICAEKNGKVFDMFRNRLMFPIIYLRGNVIGFGGRILGDGHPKYINTSDTPVFKKSRNLFSMNFAKNSGLKQLILAEGYMDVIALNQAGFENTAATLGTALTDEQARLISGYAKEVIIAYDSDAAGQTATQRAVNILTKTGVNVHIINMEGAKDPDEYIKKYGADKFKFILDNSRDAISFELEKCRNRVDMLSEEGKVEGIKNSIKILSGISDRLQRDVYTNKVAKDFDVSSDVLKSQVNNQIIKTYNKDNNRKTGIGLSASGYGYVNADGRLKEIKAEEYIIAYVIQNPDALGAILRRIPPGGFITETNRKIYAVLTEKLKSPADFAFSLLSCELSDAEMGKITEIRVKYKEILITPKVIDDCIEILINFKINAAKRINSDEDLLQLADKLKEC